MEIERKFLVRTLPDDLTQYEHHIIRQAYISTDPTMRLRQKDEQYIFTFKGEGLLAREEFEYNLTAEQFYRLWNKVETETVAKTRYCIPLPHGFVAELDIYEDGLAGLLTVEVEFKTMKDAETFTPPHWFSEEVTNDGRFSNSYLAVNGKMEKN